MKKIITLTVMVLLLFVSMAMAQNVTITQKGAFVTPGTVAYYYTNQQAFGGSQIPVPASIVVTTDAPVVRVISEDKTLGMVQVELQMTQNSLPVLVWVKIIDLKYR